MTIALALLIIVSPFAVAAALSWAAHRGDALRIRLDQFRVASPLAGLLGADAANYEVYRAERDLDAIRTRFEHHPTWPTPGVLGERR
ncbi:hypothetical protein M1247_28075 [Mycobacterium sp. 21AC1]|uniref:hypothetical protein n=1 Tax=[Mycobacterium] appelbergii TaxID=2939269 RepID=UPI0029390812|nr:hypothetical protein [Mycobacterium sp. 21AC1]MDV3128794.1 hypothetical protein [Mycobacterium sp. 21AC1]